MINRTFLTAGPAGLMVCTALLSALTGCMTEGSSQRTGYQGPPAMQPRTVVVYQDDYDYYPGYEIYYSRNRREYVYRDGSAWVRRPEPRGVSLEVLRNAPSVRLDFHDAPEQHHATVVQSYPRNWAPSNQHWGYRERPAVRTQGAVPRGDDYEYFPSYETYYSRSRHEYVFYDGRAWIRQPAPRGVAAETLSASPSVLLEFEDPPERHHASVVQRYPKNWTPPGKNHDDRDNRKGDRNNDRKPDDRRD